MAHQTEVWTIWCVLEDELSMFPIQVASNSPVGILKNKIKDAKNALAKFDADHLELYQVEISVHDDLEKSVEAKLSKNPTKLDAWLKLAAVFKDGPKDNVVHIIVKAPGSATPLAHPPQHSTTTTPLPSNFSNVDITPERVEFVDSTVVTKRVDDYLKLLRPKIREFLNSPTLPNWVPPESVDPEIRNFYNKLSIPLFNNKPSLLLHELGNNPNPNVHGLFQNEMNARLLKIFCNTSGSGKTRLLLEGLCQHWGFYFVAAKGIDDVGTRDLECMIERMALTPGWVSDIFTDPTPAKVLIANKKNVHIAHKTISKVLFARWTVFKLFIEVAKEIYEKEPNADIRKRWLLFQILPCVRVGQMDPFLALIHLCLVGVTLDVLEQLNMPFTPKDILGDAFDPLLDHFFYVLDEAQVAGKEYVRAFADADGKVPRPVLRPLILKLMPSELVSAIRTIVSGTGFSLNLFKEVVRSGVGKYPEAWDSVHSTGDFSDQVAQLAYISRYLPSPFLISPSGQNLKTRMYEWLRGRHRFTARYLEELMKGPWKANSPASPHRLLDAYVNKFSEFKPIDADPTLLEQEAEVGALQMLTFEWDKIKREPEMLEELSHSIYTYMARGEYPMWEAKWETIVEYGLGRFIAEKTAIVDEPLALVSVVRYFKNNDLTFTRKIWAGMQENKGKAFEELLYVAITQLLRNPQRLSDCVQFHPPIPDWAPLTAQLVARNSSGDFEPFGTIDDESSVPSHEVSVRANNPGDVKCWLETGEAGWCIPGTSMGPDLMTRVRLGNGKVLLLVVQAKCFFSGNQDTVTAETTAKAIRSLIPANFFASLIQPNMGKSTRKKRKKTINDMLAAINKDTATGLYDIIRVVGAFPLTANFNSRSAEVEAALGEDRHALAQLSRPALTTALAATSHGRSILSMLTMALERTRGEVDDEAESPQPRKPKRTREEADDEGEASQPSRKPKRRHGKVGDKDEAGQTTQKSTRGRRGVGDKTKPGKPGQKSRRKNGEVGDEIETGQPPRRSKRDA